LKVIKIGLLVELSWKQSNDLVDAYAPPIVKGLRLKVFNADVVCETKLKWCKPKNWKAREVEDDVARILSDKPESLKNDDFIDNLY